MMEPRHGGTGQAVSSPARIGERDAMSCIRRSSIPDHNTVLVQAFQHLGLLVLTTLAERSHVLTIPSILALIHLMLVEPLSLYSSSGGLITTGYIVSRLLTACYLTA
ncbi:hypothetical protein ACFO25_20070 [Paenactinomyces guangxiensis]|uniref:Uncharacterized protein n=1 Tax=Paenactinomyces guangxiensis TaxID=1490290 RepID=A0A7W1WTK6_9BACL|nr:hypothetical protein [Paenactinomyces guangxiensis]MBA4495789.1 hypothetical protein [Paenactinomyces guangxiensis]MBH8592879.1 hypothetical protein [Paenactinomyces guangxiensis]